MKIRCWQDYIVDIGPGAGEHGGPGCCCGKCTGNYEKSKFCHRSIFEWKIRIPVPTERKKPTGYLKVVGAQENNLKNIDVKFLWEL